MTYKTDRDLFIAIITDYLDSFGWQEDISSDDGIETFVDDWIDLHHVSRVLGIEEGAVKQNPDPDPLLPGDELPRWVNGEEE